MLDFLKSNISILILFVINIILFIMVILSNNKINKIKKSDREFMKKLGDGENIKDSLDTYMRKVLELEHSIEILKEDLNEVDGHVSVCFQKIGIVRYNAYKDTGGDLSFAVALLDENDDGVVLNGIYSREMSNIYAKPIANGKSSYTISAEENEAIVKAMECNQQIRRKT